MRIGVLIVVLSTTAAWAAAAPGLYDGRTGQAVELEQVISAARPGDILIVSEEHDTAAHHLNQLEVLEALKARDLRVSVGLEFLAYPDQAWDDTMAWHAVSFLAAHRDQVLVIIVGDFHAAHGGGLPDRLRARGATGVVTISQVGVGNLSNAEVETLLAPDPRYGARADFIWLTGP